MKRADRLKMMAATLRTGMIFRETGHDPWGARIGHLYPLGDVEAIELAFAIDANIDERIRKENMKGQL
jgi:hypothetical protein